jgi:hypothetical protein
MWFTLTPLDADYPRRGTASLRDGARDPALGEGALRSARRPRAVAQVVPRHEARCAGSAPSPSAARVGALRRADTGSGDVLEHFVAWDPGKRLAFFAEKMTTPLVSEFFEDYVITPLGPITARKLVWTVGLPSHASPFRPLMFAIRPRFAKMFDDARRRPRPLRLPLTRAGGVPLDPVDHLRAVGSRRRACDICWMPVGLVTLTSVRRPPITSRPTNIEAIRAELDRFSAAMMRQIVLVERCLRDGSADVDVRAHVVLAGHAQEALRAARRRAGARACRPSPRPGGTPAPSPCDGRPASPSR